MLVPLQQFICDTCGVIINKPDEGWIEWISKGYMPGEKRETYGFKIVHHYEDSPLKESNPNGCYQYSKTKGRSDSHLHQFMDKDYLITKLLKFLDVGPVHNPTYSGSPVIDMRQYVETFRRLTIPYFEEARQYFSQGKADGFFTEENEYSVYGPETLQRLIKEYNP